MNVRSILSGRHFAKSADSWPRTMADRSTHDRLDSAKVRVDPARASPVIGLRARNATAGDRAPGLRPGWRRRPTTRAITISPRVQKTHRAHAQGVELDATRAKLEALIAEESNRPSSWPQRAEIIHTVPGIAGRPRSASSRFIPELGRSIARPLRPWSAIAPFDDDSGKRRGHASHPGRTGKPRACCSRPSLGAATRPNPILNSGRFIAARAPGPWPRSEGTLLRQVSGDCPPVRHPRPQILAVRLAQLTSFDIARNAPALPCRLVVSGKRATLRAGRSARARRTASPAAPSSSRLIGGRRTISGPTRAVDHVLHEVAVEQALAHRAGHMVVAGPRLEIDIGGADGDLGLVAVRLVRRHRP